MQRNQSVLHGFLSRFAPKHRFRNLKVSDRSAIIIDLLGGNDGLDGRDSPAAAERLDGTPNNGKSTKVPILFRRPASGATAASPCYNQRRNARHYPIRIPLRV